MPAEGGEESDEGPLGIGCADTRDEQISGGPKVEIQGHCDERGTNEYNLALGNRRADAALAYLKTLGVAGDRMSTISFGKEKPLCTESNEACWSKNRRDEFHLK